MFIYLAGCACIRTPLASFYRAHEHDKLCRGRQGSIGPVVLATHLVDLIMTVCLIAVDKMLHRYPSAQVCKSALGGPLLAKGLNESSH